MSADRCKCCDLLVEFCGKAAADRQRATGLAQRQELLERPGWFAAQWRVMCSVCQEWSPPGTPITRHGEFGWRAGCCSDFQKGQADARQRRSD